MSDVASMVAAAPASSVIATKAITRRVSLIVPPLIERSVTPFLGSGDGGLEHEGGWMGMITEAGRVQRAEGECDRWRRHTELESEAV